jgi:hypothetical protein
VWTQRRASRPVEEADSMERIPLVNGRGFALVDDGDVPLVSGYRWYLLDAGHTCYAMARPGHRTIYMHALIMGESGPDHRDGDGLNNQRSNLRPATRTQQNANRRADLGGTSRYKGVGWHKASNRWRAYIKISGRYQGLGNFDAEADAARAYDAAAILAFGEFARLNFPR